MLIKIKEYRIEKGVFLNSIVEDGERWITGNFSSLSFIDEIDGVKYYDILLSPGHIIIDENDFNKIYQLMSK
jgi:hypothetical protein